MVCTDPKRKTSFRCHKHSVIRKIIHNIAYYPIAECRHVFYSLSNACQSNVHHHPSYTLQAFAWWSDLMVEHAETFLSLYAVDMDAALEVQPPDSWDSFPLFQLLNDYLRLDCKNSRCFRLSYTILAPV